MESSDEDADVIRPKKEIIYRRHFDVFESSSEDDRGGVDSKASSANSAASSPEKKEEKRRAPCGAVSMDGTNGKRLTSSVNHNPAAVQAAAEKPIQLAIYRQETLAYEKDGSERPTMVTIQYCQLLKTRQRTILATTPEPMQTFGSHVDHYSSLHADAVYGIKLLDLAKAFFPSKAVNATLVDVNSEPTVTGIPSKFFQTVSYIADTLHIEMDQVYPLLSSAYLPKSPSVSKNPDWRSETQDTRRFDPAKRRFPKERVIPIYLIPHFFALHPALKNDVHNNGILFGHRLIREMERRVPLKYNNAVFMDSLHQLYANFDKLAYYFQTNTEMLHGLLTKMDNMARMHDETLSHYDNLKTLVASCLEGPLKVQLASSAAAIAAVEQKKGAGEPSDLQSETLKRKRQPDEESADITLAPAVFKLDYIDDIFLAPMDLAEEDGAQDKDMAEPEAKKPRIEEPFDSKG